MFDTLFSKHNTPVITNVSCDGCRLILMCDQALDATIQPSADDFTVELAGRRVDVLSAYVRQFIHETHASIVLGLSESLRHHTQVKVGFQPRFNSVVTQEREPLRPFIDEFILAQLPEHAPITQEIMIQDPVDHESMAATVTPEVIQEVAAAPVTHAHAVDTDYVSAEPVVALQDNAMDLDAAVDDLISFESVFSEPHPPHESQVVDVSPDPVVQQMHHQPQDTQDVVPLEPTYAEQDAVLQAQAMQLSQQHAFEQQEAKRLLEEHQEHARQQALMQAQLLHELEQKEREQQETLRLLQLQQEQARQEQEQARQDALKQAERNQLLEQQLLAQQAVLDEDQSLPPKTDAQPVSEVISDELSVAPTNNATTVDLAQDLDRLIRISGDTHALLEASEGLSKSDALASDANPAPQQVHIQPETPTDVQPTVALADSSPNVTSDPEPTLPQSMTGLNMVVKGKRIHVHGIKGLDWRIQPTLDDFQLVCDGKPMVIKSVFVTKKGQDNEAVLVFVASSDNIARSELSMTYLAQHKSLKRQNKRDAISQFNVSNKLTDE